MTIGKHGRVLAYAIMSAGAVWAQAGLAQDSVEAIKAATIVDVPLVLGEVAAGQGSATLWAKGDPPADLLLASVTLRPVQAAVLDGGSATATADGVLWRAFAGGGIVVMRADELQLNSGPRTFCGTLPGRPLLACFTDEDGNGSFDHVAQALPERGAKPYHVTIIKEAQTLPAPLAYHILPAAQRPTVTVALKNCAKDYDRPRFTALSTDDRNLPVASSGFAWQAKDSSFASCRRGAQIASVPGTTATAPAGGYLAQIGPLAFAVGPKKDPRLALVGPVDRQALYRLEGATLVDLGIGRTPGQAQLIAMKKFPYPVLMTDAGASIRDGQVAVGAPVATIPFHHAYRGRLTQDISISTLFGKRSLPAGTVVYGFPAQSRLTVTRNGMPDIETVGDEQYRNINLELTWCAPVHGSEPEKPKPDAVGRGGWSAACIPYSSLGNHTIIADMQPAFSVMGVMYDASTSSNDGPPPIRREDATTFEQPLRLEYVYKGRDGEFITLAEQVTFGGQLTSSKPVRLYAPQGRVGATVAGASLDLTAETGGALVVHSAGAPVIGSNPILSWDQQAFMRQQLQKMGLRMADPQADEQPRN